MKFNRLRAEIETRASNPKADTIPTSGRRETTTECVLKTTEKKRKLEQYKHSIGAKAGGDQIARVGSGPQTENQTDVPEIRTPNKRQTRGKKIDVWAAFNSNTSVALEPCIFYEAETSDYEGLAAATDNGEWFWTDSNSEQENPAKRCRSYQTTEKTNAQDLPSFASSSYSATTLTQDVSKAVSSASDANLPPGLAIDTRSTVGKRINPWSLTPGRTDFTSTALPPSPISTPTPSDSFTSTGAIYGDSDNENLTLAIEHDSHADAIIEDVVNPTTATAPSTENNGAMHGYDGTDPAFRLLHSPSSSASSQAAHRFPSHFPMNKLLTRLLFRHRSDHPETTTNGVYHPTSRRAAGQSPICADFMAAPLVFSEVEGLMVLRGARIHGWHVWLMEN